MKRTFAICAVALLVVGAAPAMARPTHRCVARAPGGCPNQHPRPIIHGQAVVFHAPPIIGVQGGHRHKGKPKVRGITVTRETDSASPGLFQRTQ